MLETGLNELMKKGLVPFLSTESVNFIDIYDSPELDQ